jgi:hypothetical protein
VFSITRERRVSPKGEDALQFVPERRDLGEHRFGRPDGFRFALSIPVVEQLKEQSIRMSHASVRHDPIDCAVQQQNIP